MTNNEKNYSESDLLNLDVEQITGYLLARSAQLWRKALVEAIKPLDLTDTQYFLLSISHHLQQKHFQVTQALIAQHGEMDTMMVSQVIRRMESKGFLRRTPHPTDSRAKVITLTTAGTQTLSRARSHIMNAARVFFQPLDNEENFNQQLRKLYETHIKDDKSTC